MVNSMFTQMAVHFCFQMLRCCLGNPTCSQLRVGSSGGLGDESMKSQQPLRHFAGDTCEPVLINSVTVRETHSNVTDGTFKGKTLRERQE